MEWRESICNGLKIDELGRGSKMLLSLSEDFEEGEYFIELILGGPDESCNINLTNDVYVLNGLWK